MGIQLGQGRDRAPKGARNVGLCTVCVCGPSLPLMQSLRLQGRTCTYMRDELQSPTAGKGKVSTPELCYESK